MGEQSNTYGIRKFHTPPPAFRSVDLCGLINLILQDLTDPPVNELVDIELIMATSATSTNCLLASHDDFTIEHDTKDALGIPATNR